MSRAPSSIISFCNATLLVPSELASSFTTCRRVFPSGGSRTPHVVCKDSFCQGWRDEETIKKEEKVRLFQCPDPLPALNIIHFSFSITFSYLALLLVRLFLKENQSISISFSQYTPKSLQLCPRFLSWIDLNTFNPHSKL